MNLKWYKIDVKSKKNFTPPFFAGSMLRGAFGIALKRVVCINPTYKCNNCFSCNNCIYYDFYEVENSFKKYKISSKLSMKRLSFSIYLYDETTQELPYILSAIKKSLEEVGVGKEKQQVELSEISIGSKIVYNGKDFLPIVDVKPYEFKCNEYYQNIELNFSMPMSLKYKNQYVTKDKVSLYILITNLHKRFAELKGLPTKKIDFKIEGEIVQNSLKFIDLFRYSNRKKRRMKFTGLIGKVVIKGIDRRSYEYLKLGEIIGIGKQTVFGLGDYTIRAID
ncbi:CRISPR system precrRNA processing endoribonuclease RAMP protein Cas6 [Hydrogenimonas thermophila]|uniref:CRISPR system precrRNA processing endoribonuclease RAMP protein Cas6 n=1 Tax=Hydrogenimonas thermophila TaxID=223786 RepID=UPI002936DB78|nr:CRISPR system precrRNA processing endoribonuclease RAMP protein Cas6 [Hydrogenimonas thermophila]WOE70984.1 CRISPR system precrRNA processing endoribonuclease RAMP protein Cas6 [Hydrogenimonas thermophila]WOE73502.1 CRISPR system precrRNA processing endoribonuclease RAMP protein Cas6 [Hydrogenimonas thermophila]